MAPRKKSRQNRRKPEDEKGLLAIQLAFAKKFGRFPADDDPVFFDPDADTPQPLDPNHVLRGMLEAMLKAGTPAQLIYACYVTGFIVAERNRDQFSEEQLGEWEAAIDEYFAFVDRRKTRQKKPDSFGAKVVPSYPTTVIPELLVMELTEGGYRAVVEIVEAASRIQNERMNPTGGPNLRWRIELASAFLAAAIDHGYNAGEATKHDPEKMADLAIDLTVRRAMEIWVQGGA
jgi:hypothetical protein